MRLSFQLDANDLFVVRVAPSHLNRSAQKHAHQCLETPQSGNLHIHAKIDLTLLAALQRGLRHRVVVEKTDALLLFEHCSNGKGDKTSDIAHALVTAKLVDPIFVTIEKQTELG